MMTPLKLHEHEKEIALKVWLDLKSGAPNAHLCLKNTSETIREAILHELDKAVENGKTPENPFVD